MAVAAVVAGCGGDGSEPADVGSLRFADLERAADEAVACMQEAGLEATAEYDADIFGHGFEVKDPGPATTGVMDGCVADLYQPTSDHWQALHADEIDARNLELERLIVACLHERGFAFDELDEATRDDIDRRDPDARSECLIEASDELGGS